MLAWAGVIVWQDRANRDAAIGQAAEFSMTVHDSTLAGLTALMIVERMDRSEVLLDQIKELDIVRDLRVVPSGVAFDGVTSSKDARPRTFPIPNADETKVLLSGEAVIEVRDDETGPYLLVIRPAVNAERYLGKNCVECHDAAVNDVLGVISMKVSLAGVFHAQKHLRMESIFVAAAVSLMLLAFIWVLIRSARQSLDHAEMAAATDVLTGLPNRRGFAERMRNEFERIKRDPNHNSCVMMLDIDHFKRINDTFGHAAGDVVLRRFGLLLTEVSRKSDVPGRVGGEEFALILHGIGLDLARQIADRFRRRVAETEVPFEGNVLRVTVSVGIAAIQSGDFHYDESLGRADRALYRAKGQGRNQVCGPEVA